MREGLSLYRRQAFAFTALVILYSMALMLIANVPLVGLPLAALLVPFGTVGITAAGREVERNVVPMPSLLIDGVPSARTRAITPEIAIAMTTATNSPASVASI